MLSNEDLEAITGKKRYSAQASWFKESFAIDPVCRPDGSIMLTPAAFEALLLKRMGVEVGTSASGPDVLPPVYPLFKAKKLGRRS